MRHLQRTLPAAALALLASGAASAADCTAATVKGVWGFSYDGFNLQANAYCAGLGLMTFTSPTRGNNTVKITTQRESCDGDPVAAGGATGTYTVTTTCTGRSTNLNYGSAGTARLDFNIVEAGSRLQFVLVVNGITLRGEAVKR